LMTENYLLRSHSCRAAAPRNDEADNSLQVR
jgi:hypothetical protein